MSAVSLRTVLEQSTAEIEASRELFREYQRSIDVDLCFQDFEREVKELPGEYAPPGGRLLLCFHEGKLAGCVALRGIDESICEMKRLYVRPTFRGKHLGKQLVDTVISQARAVGYTQMRLDTLPSMKEAIALYRSMGFTEIAPYRHNPVSGALFMELDLSS